MVSGQHLAFILCSFIKIVRISVVYLCSGAVGVGTLMSDYLKGSCICSIVAGVFFVTPWTTSVNKQVIVVSKEQNKTKQNEIHAERITATRKISTTFTTRFFPSFFILRRHCFSPFFFLSFFFSFFPSGFITLTVLWRKRKLVLVFKNNELKKPSQRYPGVHRGVDRRGGMKKKRTGRTL